jgi:putative hemolysin
MTLDIAQAFVPQTFQALEHPLLPSDWKAKVPFEIRQSRYVIKIANSLQEFREVIQLRTDVFLKEFAQTSDESRVDIEPRDLDADFLIIKDARDDVVLASYRLICSDYSQDFYSKSEFLIDDFLASPGRKLELSRACVKADRRASGIFVHLLWRGLAEYIGRTQSKYLFGCSSIQSLELKQIVDVYRYLKQESAFCDEFSIRPHQDYTIFSVESLKQIEAPTDRQLSDQLLPPILAGYLKAGAKIFGAPAYDQDFNCLDLFTILDFEDLSAAHLKKYLQS